MKFAAVFRNLLAKIRLMGSRVAALEQRVNDLEGQVSKYQAKNDAIAVPPGSTVFGGDQIRQFRVTADNGSTLTTKLQAATATGIGDDTEETGDFTIIKNHAETIIPVDTIIPATMEGVKDNGDPIFVMAQVNRIVCFPVVVSEDGSGSNGDADNPPSYTYTVDDLDGNELGTGVAVEFARANGEYDPATKGLAYFTAAGTLKLLLVDEIETTEDCEGA